MSLVVPVPLVNQNGQLCADGSTDYPTLVPVGHVQLAISQLPMTRVPSTFNTIPSSVSYVPGMTHFTQATDESAVSRNVVHHNIRQHVSNTSSVSTSKYVGLPYQDHNYVQLPPSTPPLSPASVLLSASSKTFIDDISYNTTIITTADDSITRCICEFQHDDGYMIQCDKCGVWQHVDCMEVDRENIPESYMCELCEPRKVDKHKAIQIQTKKRDALSLQHMDSSATETEDETTDGRRWSIDKSPVKKELKDSCSGIGSMVLNKKRKTKSKRDERLKRKLHMKRQAGGQKLSMSTPRKPHFEPLSIDGFGETVRQDAALPQNGALVMPVSSLNLSPASIEVYQEAIANGYTTELQNLLASIKFNGQQGGAVSPSVYERLQLGPSCFVAQVSSTRMGLEACEDILTNQPLIEYVGKVMLQDQYDKDSLFYLRAEPNVLFYSKLGGLDLCIDASSYGNMARFVRRSCTPNAEVRHLLEGNTVRFFLGATKSIVRGAEITIPFDFNYHKCSYVVDCACTRVSCPVAKFQRREASHSAGPAAKRQRSTRSLEAVPYHDSASVSPRKLTSSGSFLSSLSSSLSSSSFSSAAAVTVAASVVTPVKQNRMALPNSFRKDSVSEIEESFIKTEVESVKMEPMSPTWMHASANAATALESEPSRAVPAASVPTSVSLCASVNETDESDKTKKKTREEKKLEAVMKMFERLEKQQERKKEAQSRQEHPKAKESTKTKELKKSKDKDRDRMDSKIPVEMITSEAKMPTADASVSNNEQLVVATAALSEVPAKVESKARVKRTRQGSASRRASMCVTSNTFSSFNQPGTVPPSDIKGTQSTCSSTVLTTDDGGGDAAAAAAAPFMSFPSVSLAETVTAVSSSSSDKWTGFPKKLLMRGQDLSKQLSIKTEGLELNNSECEYGSEFVQCVPSPHSCSLNTLRRNSMPASNGSSSFNCKTLLSIPSYPGPVQPDAKGCSAKKRWLQQAMCDKTDSKPSGEDMAVAGKHSSSNGISPTDFVTPLKKRRLARESLSIDSSPPAVKQETSVSSTNSFPQYESISDDDHTDVEMGPSNSRDTPEDTAASGSAGVRVWSSSQIVDTKDSNVARVNGNLLTDDGLLRTQMPLHVDLSRSLLHPVTPENFVVMPVGYKCQSEDSRILRSDLSGVASVTSMPNGFGPNMSTGLASVQNSIAWQQPSQNTVASGIDSRLSIANLYTSASYLSSLIPSGQKQDSFNANRLIDYRLPSNSMGPEHPVSAPSSVGSVASLTVGYSPNDAGISNAIYLNKQLLGHSEISGGQPATVAFHTMNAVNSDSQGIMSLVEAACRSSEKAVDSKNLNSGQQNCLQIQQEDNKEIGEKSGNLPYGIQTTANTDHCQKIQGYYNMSNCEPCAVFLPLSSGSTVPESSSDNEKVSLNGKPSSMLLHNDVYEINTPRTDGRELQVTKSGQGETVVTGQKNDNSCYTQDGNMSDLSSALASPSAATAGQCPSKKKVSLSEYKMRRKSGGTSQSKVTNISGSVGDADSLIQSFESGNASLLQKSGSLVSPTHPPLETCREISDSMSLAWNTNATAAEKTLEKLQSSDKLFKIDKGFGTDVCPSSSFALLARGSHHPGSLISPVQSLTAVSAISVASAKSEPTDCSSESIALKFDAARVCDGGHGNMGPANFVARQPLTNCEAVPISIALPNTGSAQTPVFLTSTFCDIGRIESNAQNVQTSSDINSKPNCTFLVQR